MFQCVVKACAVFLELNIHKKKMGPLGIFISLVLVFFLMFYHIPHSAFHFQGINTSLFYCVSDAINVDCLKIKSDLKTQAR